MRRLGTPAGAAGTALVAWGWTIGLRPLTDNSFFTHLATGRLILDAGVPTVDPYSFTARGEPWVVQSWLASVVFAVIERLGGGLGLVLLHAGLTAALAAVLWAMSRPAETLAARIALVAPGLAVGTVAWRERPFLFAALALAVMILACERWAPSRIDRWWQRVPWFVVPTVWLWANVHGSWPLAIAVPATVAAGRALDRDDPFPALGVAAAAGVGVLVAALGPLGFRLWVFPFELAGRREFLAHVAEWRPIDLGSPWQAAFAVQLALAGVAVWRRRSWSAALIWVACGVGAALAVRNIALASVLVVAIAAPGLSGLGVIRGARRSRAAGLVTGTLAVIMALSVPLAGAGDAYDLAGYPLRGLVRWDVATGTTDPARCGCRLVAPDRVGNLRELIDGERLEGDRGVFVDDRFDMFPVEVLDDLLALERRSRVIRGDWRAALARHEARYIIWERVDPLARELDDDRAWGRIWSDERWGLWGRRA